VIEKNINTILDNCRCDYIEELMTAVFIAHTKMLTAIRVSTRQKKLSITLPKLDHFLHRVFVECARALWKAPFLLSNELSTIERQKNILHLESIFSESMSNAVRSLLPVKSILREYLDEGEEDAKVAAKEETKEPVIEFEDIEEQGAEETEKTEKTEKTEEAEKAEEAEKTEKTEKTEKAEKAETVQDEPLNKKAADDSSPKSKPKSIKQTIKLEKMETPPGVPTPVGSDHTVALPPVAAGVQVAKEAEPPTMQIETEPAVHFTPYDTVYDETTSSISEIRYAPKLSVEDKPPSTWGMDPEEDLGPTLVISNTVSEIGGDDIQDLDAPTPKEEVTQKEQTQEQEQEQEQEQDIDAPLSTTDDFVELA
jgi:hypothetical protein